MKLSIYLSIFGTYFLLPFSFLLAFDSAELSPKGASEVTIPNFDKDGIINWTLKATEVIARGSSRYLVKKPSLKMLASDNIVFNASSALGSFDLTNGTATGETFLQVSGDGFSAKGNTWSWQQQSDAGLHQMSLESDAYVLFRSEVEPVLPAGKKVAGKSKKEISNLQNTKATADVIDFVSHDHGGYLFILEGNVLVKSESLEIVCSKMEIRVESDQNQTENSSARITEMNATGNVKMKQSGRICEADNITLDTVGGYGLLVGNARVQDDEWGIVTGEKVELDKTSGRARVIGTGVTKPRLELPDVGKISLPGLRKSKKN